MLRVIFCPKAYIFNEVVFDVKITFLRYDVRRKKNNLKETMFKNLTDEKDLNLNSLDAFRCFLYGKRAIAIEGKIRLTDFDCGKIVLESKRAKVEITGKELTIKQMTGNYALVCGDILGVNYVGKD